jgi:hypothetical protein
VPDIDCTVDDVYIMQIYEIFFFACVGSLVLLVVRLVSVLMSFVVEIFRVADFFNDALFF